MTGRGRVRDRAERDGTGRGGTTRGGRGVTRRAARVGRGGTGTNSERGAAGACQDQRRGRDEIEIGLGMAERGERDTTGQAEAFL